MTRFCGILVIIVHIAYLVAAVELTVDQTPDLTGTFFTPDCLHYADTSEGSVYTKRYMELNDNNYLMRLSLSLDENCTTFDVALTFSGYIAYGLGNITNTIEASNVDLGMNKKELQAITPEGSQFLSKVCDTEYPQWAIVSGAEMNCPELYVFPFSQCTTHYTIALLSIIGRGEDQERTLQLGELETAVDICKSTGRTLELGDEVYEQILPGFPDITSTYWLSCTPGPQNGTWHTLRYFIVGRAFTRTLRQYHAADCSLASLDVISDESGTLLVMEPLEEDEGDDEPPVEDEEDGEEIFNVEFTLSEKSYYVANPAIADQLNALTNTEECGYRVFTPNTFIDVSSLDCPAAGFASLTNCPRHYDIIAEYDDHLYVGQYSSPLDRCTPDGRPTELIPEGMIDFDEDPPEFLHSELILIGVFGGVCVIMILTVACCCCRRRDSYFGTTGGYRHRL